MSRYSSLLIGCGNRGQTHARALADSDGFEFAAVCDHDLDQAETIADEYGVLAVYQDHKAAIRDPEIDHVTAVTSPTVRLPLLADLLDADIDSLLFEKPVANTLDEVERIDELAAESEALVTVSHQKIYADEFRAVKQWLDEGVIGEPFRFIATAKGGLTGQGTHFLHALDWLIGDKPETVRAFAEGGIGLDPARNEWCPAHAEPEDTVIELSYPGNVRAYVHLGPDAPDVNDQRGTFWYEFRLDAIGSAGRAEFVLGDHAVAVTSAGREYEDARDFDEDAYMTRALYDDIASTLDGTLPRHPTDLKSAVDVHRTIDAAMRSPLEGRAIPSAERPPALGQSTPDRLRRHLLGRSPISVSTLIYRDRPREDVLSELAAMGVTEVDLWSFSEFATHFDPETETAADVRRDLDRYGMQAPIMTFFDEEPVEQKLAFAAEIGAKTAVTFGRTPERPSNWNPEMIEPWLDRAAELGMTIAFENHFNYMETIDEMEAMLDALDHPAARIALAPPHLWHSGNHCAADALVRLGDRIDVLYLWDTHPGGEVGGEEPWWSRPDDQLPGGGGVVDFERLLEAAVEHAPNAHWTLCYHGTDDWEENRIAGSVARALRVIEANRPG